MPKSSARPTRQLLIRVSTETYAALQLAQPFAQRRSMQDLLTSMIDEFLVNLRAQDPGYRKALVGLRESSERREGILARNPTAIERDSS